jgi:hypothetical protein
MSAPTKLQFSQVSLIGLSSDAKDSLLQDVLNNILGRLGDGVLTLSPGTPNSSPTNGELYFDGSKLWLAVDGTYRQVYP